MAKTTMIVLPAAAVTELIVVVVPAVSFAAVPMLVGLPIPFTWAVEATRKTRSGSQAASHDFVDLRTPGSGFCLLFIVFTFVCQFGNTVGLNHVCHQVSGVFHPDAHANSCGEGFCEQFRSDQRG